MRFQNITQYQITAWFSDPFANLSYRYHPNRRGCYHQSWCLATLRCQARCCCTFWPAWTRGCCLPWLRSSVSASRWRTSLRPGCSSSEIRGQGCLSPVWRGRGCPDFCTATVWEAESCFASSVFSVVFLIVEDVWKENKICRKKENLKKIFFSEYNFIQLLDFFTKRKHTISSWAPENFACIAERTENNT